MSSKRPDTIGEIQIVLQQILDNQHTNQQTNAKRFDEIVEHLKYTNGKVMKNTEFRLKTQGVMGLLKSIGVINILVIIGLIVNYFTK